MFSVFSTSPHPVAYSNRNFAGFLSSNRKKSPVLRTSFSSSNDEANSTQQNQLDFYHSDDLFGLGTELQIRDVGSHASNPRSWFGPNGQYIRELPCPSCRGRGYTPCTECGIERSRSDCSVCNGKGLMTCGQCSGDCVIWEESWDERPWEKVRSSSPLKVKEDDEVDNLEIKLDPSRKTKRVYQSPSPEVGQKISRSLKSLNAKTGLFSKRMKIIHRDPKLHAQRVAAIKKAKGTPAARKQASDTLKAFFSDPENRRKRSIVMKGVKFYCRHCGEEGHRRHYCPALKDKSAGSRKFKCRVCGERGHNRRTCPMLRPTDKKSIKKFMIRQCSICGQSGHNRRTCSKRNAAKEGGASNTSPTSARLSKRSYTCSLCSGKGHNRRTCHPSEDL
ncbi:hypothetical protein H6P81_014858 [Aristolochia fimbriata]|uniref:CCHC-type domain-containing protein n=1 Tax=Aristolochia fimbriata TaxID=158543 RepID=A0AAV7E4K0_ARIFI|nr:hypothetical protein H6P81_014858 [Aristolochia fimbriata]